MQQACRAYHATPHYTTAHHTPTHCHPRACTYKNTHKLSQQHASILFFSNHCLTRRQRILMAMRRLMSVRSKEKEKRPRQIYGRAKSGSLSGSIVSMLLERYSSIPHYIWSDKIETAYADLADVWTSKLIASSVCGRASWSLHQQCHDTLSCPVLSCPALPCIVLSCLNPSWSFLPRHTAALLPLLFFFFLSFSFLISFFFFFFFLSFSFLFFLFLLLCSYIFLFSCTDNRPSNRQTDRQTDRHVDVHFSLDSGEDGGSGYASTTSNDATLMRNEAESYRVAFHLFLQQTSIPPPTPRFLFLSFPYPSLTCCLPVCLLLCLPGRFNWTRY